MSDLRDQLRRLFTSLEMRVLNQYVRCVLGVSGVTEYVYAVGLDRLQRADDKRINVSIAHIWHAVATELNDGMRSFVSGAVVTDRCTLRGFQVRRGLTPRRRSVFITWHPHEERVVGIYKGAQWNHKCAYRFARQKSHRVSPR